MSIRSNSYGNIFVSSETEFKAFLSNLDLRLGGFTLEYSYNENDTISRGAVKYTGVDVLDGIISEFQDLNWITLMRGESEKFTWQIA